MSLNESFGPKKYQYTAYYNPDETTQVGNVTIMRTYKNSYLGDGTYAFSYRRKGTSTWTNVSGTTVDDFTTRGAMNATLYDVSRENNDWEIKVTVTNETASNTYYVDLMCAPTGSLANIQFNRGTLDKPFTPGVYSYTLTYQSGSAPQSLTITKIDQSTEVGIGDFLGRVEAYFYRDDGGKASTSSYIGIASPAGELTTTSQIVNLPALDTDIIIETDTCAYTIRVIEQYQKNTLVREILVGDKTTTENSWSDKFSCEIMNDNYYSGQIVFMTDGFCQQVVDNTVFCVWVNDADSTDTQTSEYEDESKRYGTSVEFEFDKNWTGIVKVRWVGTVGSETIERAMNYVVHIKSMMG